MNRNKMIVIVCILITIINVGGTALANYYRIESNIAEQAEQEMEDNIKSNSEDGIDYFPGVVENAVRMTKPMFTTTKKVEESLGVVITNAFVSLFCSVLLWLPIKWKKDEDEYIRKWGRREDKIGFFLIGSTIFNILITVFDVYTALGMIVSA